MDCFGDLENRAKGAIMVSSMRESIVTSSTCPRKQGIGRKRKRQDINNAGQSLRVLDVLDIPVVHI